MKQFNFLLIFIFCLAIALFCLQNTEVVTIQLIPGFPVNGPLGLELTLTAGLGAILAWLFSIWVKLQEQLTSIQDLKEMQAKQKRIEALEKELEKYKVPKKEAETRPKEDSKPKETDK